MMRNDRPATLKTIFIDLDDTLWPCQRNYDAAMQATWNQWKMKHQTRYGGIPLFSGNETYDMAEFIQRTFSYSIKCLQEGNFSLSDFPWAVAKSMLDYYPNLTLDDLREIMAIAAREVYSADYRQFPGVDWALSRLSSKPQHRLVAYTMGNNYLQVGKLHRAGLLQYFDRVEVLKGKDEAILSKLARQYGVSTLDSDSIGIVVGDSRNHDIIPAIRCGLFPIWINPELDQPYCYIMKDMGDQPIPLYNELYDTAPEFNIVSIGDPALIPEAIDLVTDIIERRRN